MAGITKVVKFSEGVSTTQPLTTFLSTTSYAPYANDAAFVTAKGSAAADGDSYYNTTLDLVRVYANALWTSLVDETTAQTISGVKTYSSVITSSNTTQATNKDTGAIVTEGGLGVEKNAYIGGNLEVTGNTTITGDLTVNGTTTTINTSTMDIEDSNITVNVGGSTATANANDAGLRVDLSDGTDCQLMFDSTATSKFKIGQVGSESEVATLGLTQVFTAKTFDDAVTLKQVATPSNPAATYNKFYVKSDDKPYVLTSAGVEKGIGGLSAWVTATPYTAGDIVFFTDDEIYKAITNHTSGTFLTDQASGYWVRLSEVDRNNLNLNPNGETGVVGYTTYADAAGTIPVDMTGGSPNITWNRNLTLPLKGVSDFTLVKDAVNRQGQGITYTATMPKSLYAKTVQISFDYTVASGTYADNDLYVYAYDITNSALIEPINVGIASVATGLPNKHIAFIPTSLTGASYRIGIHVSSTSTSAYTLQFSNFFVGEQVSSYGPVVTDAKTFTPSTTWVSNVTWSGVYYRVGEFAKFFVYGAFTGAPTATPFILTLPNGLNIDTTSPYFSTVNVANLGEAAYLDGGTGRVSSNQSVEYVSATSVRIRNGNAAYSEIVPITWANTDELQFSFEVPIVGWSSNVVLSNDAGDGRGIYVNYDQTASSITSLEAVVVASTKREDNLNAYSTSTGLFTAPVTGYYNFSGFIRVAGTFTANQTVVVVPYVNGVSLGGARSQYYFAETNSSYGNVTYSYQSIKLNKGDTLGIYASTLSTAPGIERFSFMANLAAPGSQRIALTEVYAKTVSPTFTTPILGVASATSMKVDSGTAAAPSYSFNSDTDTGLYNTANLVGIATGGASRLTVDSTGRIAGSAGINRGLSTTQDTAQTSTYYIESGTYSPTITGIANITTVSTPGTGYWMRVGNAVNFWGEFTATGTTISTLTQVSVTIPIASAFSTNTEGSGSMSRRSTGTNVGSMDMRNSNDDMVASWILGATEGGNSRTFGFHCSYFIVA